MGIMLSVCRECVEDNFLTFIANGTIRVLKDKQTGDHIYTIHTTDELYEKFKDIVNKEYPNVCEFDIYDQDTDNEFACIAPSVMEGVDI